LSAVASAVDLVEARALRRISREILEAGGMGAEDASITADALVWADLHGAHAQGAATKIPQAVPRIRAGVTRADANVVPLREHGAMTILDANDAWGPVAATRGMRVAIANAKREGVGLAIVRNSSTGCGMGYYPLLAVAEHLIGWVMNDSQLLQPAWGGKTATLGNQAFAIGVPASRHAPLLFDTATTAITLNKIEQLRDEGRVLPEGVALDARGEPTIDPVAALAGILLPMGGHRGSGLALMWEILTGVLAGGPRFAGNVTGLNDLTQPCGVSFFTLAIDPTIAMPYEQFTARVDMLIDQVHASPPAAGGAGRVRAPGERGAEMAAQRERDGIPLPAARAAKLRALAQELGVAW
jgi:LDH2 family malate/lactate/ureidoglycolate dehydrogenase